MVKTLFSCLYDLANLRENRVIANKMCFTVHLKTDLEKVPWEYKQPVIKSAKIKWLVGDCRLKINVICLSPVEEKLRIWHIKESLDVRVLSAQ